MAIPRRNKFLRILANDFMTLKIQLAKGEFKGNLKESQQHYKINYLPIVKELDVVTYNDKIELALITPSNDGESSYHSLRMVDPAQVRILILDLIKAYIKFKKEKGELTEFTSGYILQDLEKETKKIIKAISEGEYD